MYWQAIEVDDSRGEAFNVLIPWRIARRRGGGGLIIIIREVGIRRVINEWPLLERSKIRRKLTKSSRD